MPQPDTLTCTDITMKRLLPPTLLSLFMLLAVAVPAHAQAPVAQDCPEQLDENGKAMTYSLYFEEFKNGNYQTSLPYLRTMLACAPTYPDQRPLLNYQRIITLYDSLSVRAGDPAGQRAYADSALMMYDAAVATFQAEGVDYDAFEWEAFDKARYIQANPDRLPDAQDDVTALYLKAYEMDPQRLGGYGDGYYLNILIADKVQQANESGDLDVALDFMEEVEETMGEDLSDNVAGYIDQLRDALLQDPEARMEYLTKKLENEPENQEVLTELFNLYRTEGYRDEMYELGARLLDMEPTFTTYRLLGTMYLEDGEIGQAIELFEKAAEMPDANPDAGFYFNFGNAMQQQGNLRQARSYYRQAVEVDSDFTRAYEAIGDLYVQAVSECGSTPRDRAVYWLAVDYYQRAGASSKARTYRQYFPSAEDKFMSMDNVADGASYNINYGCYGWIGETTTVR